ncbi:uncharacterized protein MONBRDRAFT_13539 [Monosiga brevicollis MX1]|uniref:GH18 domain-containing protein n=1 Tax=Monosiga brevicollis TaxID=81824 RepID=A9UQ33_MONBE|nr:uncharacterized protein MONBRDRAFT_13539 [Monosiga brevicollis MX1]EDQ92527.1 predicted protein [Monosiga brevicollis MX1]|eukprot:XP_001742289.1 hypothetical protein [Monosiga brevicollis MX1]
MGQWRPIVLALAVLAWSGVVVAGCPCEDASLCQPLKLGPRKEVFGFGSSQAAWTEYRLDVLTTIAWNTNKTLLCEAHRANVRVVAKAINVNETVFSDAATQAAWIDATVAMITENYLDGLNFDYESPINLSSPQRAQYVALVNNAARAIKKINPFAQISVDVAWGPYDVDGRNYDYVGLAAAADLLFIMAYDTRSQIYGPCLASANTPLGTAERGVQEYLALGIPASKLVLGLPWYGYDYPCVPNTQLNDTYCPIAAVPFQGAPCSDAAGREYDWTVFQRLFRNASVEQTTVRQDALLVSKTFNYVSDDGLVHQVWFDDQATLAPKFQLARQYDLLGTGVWNIDCLYDPSAPASQAGQVAAMWEAMAVFQH